MRRRRQCEEGDDWRRLTVLVSSCCELRELANCGWRQGGEKEMWKGRAYRLDVCTDLFPSRNS